jgi:hypothetical protein
MQEFTEERHDGCEALPPRKRTLCGGLGIPLSLLLAAILAAGIFMRAFVSENALTSSTTVITDSAQIKLVNPLTKLPGSHSSLSRTAVLTGNKFFLVSCSLLAGAVVLAAIVLSILYAVKPAGNSVPHSTDPEDSTTDSSIIHEKKSGLDGIAIVGIVCGCVIFVGLVIGGVLAFHRRHLSSSEEDLVELDDLIDYGTSDIDRLKSIFLNQNFPAGIWDKKSVSVERGNGFDIELTFVIDDGFVLPQGLTGPQKFYCKNGTKQLEVLLFIKDYFKCFVYAPELISAEREANVKST